MEDLRELVKQLQETIERQQRELDKLQKKKPKKAEDNSHLIVREAFTIGYYKAFGHDYPVWGAKENSQIKALINGVGAKKAIWLIGWYFKWTEPFIVQAGHTLGLLLTNIVKMEAQLHRKGRYYEQVAEANVAKRMILEDLKQEKEVMARAELKHRQRTNQQIAFNARGELPEPACEES